MGNVQNCDGYINIPSSQTCRNYSFFYCFGLGSDWVHLVRLPLFGLLYQPQTMDNDEYEAISGNEWQRKPKYLENACTIAALSNTKPHYLGSNSGRCDGKPETICLSYGTIYRNRKRLNKLIPFCTESYLQTMWRLWFHINKQAKANHQ
jgi:hypothetical protein